MTEAFMRKRYPGTNLGSVRASSEDSDNIRQRKRLRRSSVSFSSNKAVTVKLVGSLKKVRTCLCIRFSKDIRGYSHAIMLEQLQYRTSHGHQLLESLHTRWNWQLPNLPSHCKGNKENRMDLTWSASCAKATVFWVTHALSRRRNSLYRWRRDWLNMHIMNVAVLL